MPDELAWQWDAAPAFFGAFGWTGAATPATSRPTTCSAASRRPRSRRAATALLFTGDRDMFQCVSEDVAVLFPRRAPRAGPSTSTPPEVRERYGIEPEQVPDFIALRGDPSDGIPGAKGIGEKTARDLLREYGDARRARSRTRMRQSPRVRAALHGQADELRDFRHMATLQPVPVERPADRPTDFAAAADGRRGARHAPAGGAAARPHAVRARALSPCSCSC